MTREEAIKELSYIADEMPSMECSDWKKAIYMAIEALEKEPFMNKPCVSEKVCEHDKQKVLDKIRAEIESINLNEVAIKYENRFYGFQQETLAIIDKHIESEE